MNWKHSAIAVTALVPVLGMLAWGMGRNANEIPSPLPGRAAPSFRLAVMPPAEQLPVKDTVALAQHAGDVVVLNFWASWCLACRSEHEILSRVAQQYAGQGVHFYGVLYNDKAENGREWIEEMGGQSYPALLDPGSRTAIDYGLYGVPETFFIGPDGKVLHKQIGPVTEEVLVEQIEKARAKAVSGP